MHYPCHPYLLKIVHLSAPYITKFRELPMDRESTTHDCMHANSLPRRTGFAPREFNGLG
jgi:hypothetical protein